MPETELPIMQPTIEAPKQASDYSNLYLKALYKGWEEKLNFGDVLDIVRENCGREIEIEGGENIPQEGPYIIASNHFARADNKEKMTGPDKMTDMFVSMAVIKSLTNKKVLWPESLDPRPEAYPPKSLNKFGEWLLKDAKFAGANVIRRVFFQLYKHADDMVAVPSGPDVGRLITLYTKFRDHFKKGEVVGIFPEGEVSHDMKEAKQGTSFFAIKKQVPVVPVSMYDDNGKLKVKVGKPLDPPEKIEEMENFTTEIMTSIASNLPDELKGYYGPYIKVKLPSEVKQVSNFLKARERMRNIEIKGPVVRSVISGLLTIIPEEVEMSGILEREDLLSLANDLLSYQVAFNDRLDFELSNRSDISDIIDQSKAKEVSTKETLAKAIDSLSDRKEATWIADLINNLTVETETVEKHIREKGENLTIEDSINYRRLVNAIAICTVTSVLLGMDSLGERLKPIPTQQMNWESIYKKYEWVFGELTRNPVEKAILTMDRVATVSQIDDDWFGRHIDELLNVPSVALTAIKQANGNEHIARNTVYKYRNEFILEAQKQGLGMIPTLGVTKGFQEMQKANRAFTRNARKHLQIIKKTGIFKKMKLPVRELLYIRGEL